MLHVQRHESQWIHTCKSVLHSDPESLWKTLIQLKLWLWLGLDWRTGNSAQARVRAVSGILLDSKEDPERLIRMQKGTSVTNHRYVMH